MPHNISRLLPSAIHNKLLLRSNPGVTSARVIQRRMTGFGGLLLDKARFVPFSVRRWLTRRSDSQLGATAGRLARTTGTYLVSYSYYGFDGFRALGRSDMLFQLHPHPATIRRLLNEEMAAHPESADSLRMEWELSLPEHDFDHLVMETQMARSFIVASSFTRDSLIENGAVPSAIRVVPYGVDLLRFHPRTQSPKPADGPLKLLFVGRINQRKGLRYLVEALQQLPHGMVELAICGRVLDSVEGLGNCSIPILIRPSISNEELVVAYQEADLFVLPSLAEGFGQVLLEALASGLPILSTTRTAAPDLIEDGAQGFIVEPQRSDLLADRITWAAEHRRELGAMGIAARKRAELFTWERFRTAAAAAVEDFMSEAVPQPERGAF
ncbi:MAG: glycosyltransferase family 4 protein [Edaphobacter sp.]|uniref:glycosyltransferase family 4 protein n=1 Tax=Edaphobacter sp. TaxID=1934404 RepID=UPI00239AE76B|nr:glycosyltransferase family 4 protein [Edaphobacter sp.]MDE1175571.1 glycosyltransferase family 4 protein [Edaphobacter sp.]